MITNLTEQIIKEHTKEIAIILCGLILDYYFDINNKNKPLSLQDFNLLSELSVRIFEINYYKIKKND